MSARVDTKKMRDERNQINPISDAFLLKANEFVERLPSVLSVRTLIASSKPTNAKLERKVRYFENVSRTSSGMTISL
jgi:hypothetical protein